MRVWTMNRRMPGGLAFALALAMALSAGAASSDPDPEPTAVPDLAQSASAPDGPSPADQPPLAPAETPAATPAPSTTIEVRLLASEAEAFQLCEAFMQRMVAGSYDDAFALIRPYFPISEQKFATLRDETKKQHGLAELQFGRALGSAYIDTATVKDVLLRVRFIERYEFEAIHWEFVFYRPERGWLLNRVGFDDDADALFR